MIYTQNRRTRGSAPAECSINNCEKVEQLRRGMCHMHYERLRVYGSTDAVGPSFAEGFWAKVDKRGPDECWPWTGARVHGYGAYGHDDPSGFHRSRRAPRIAYEMATGEAIPAHLQVCHRCDNPPCVNVAHLFLGTAADNSADKLAKGRGHHMTAHGERSGRAKLKEPEIVAIRQRVADGETRTSVARAYGVSVTHITRIVRGSSWAHVQSTG